MEIIETNIMKLELELLESTTRSNYQRLDALLTNDFLEVGATGGSFDKAYVLSHLLSESDITFTATDMKACVLNPTVVLVTYLATRFHAGETTYSKRSSVWVYNSCGWQMRYHQGTNA